MVQLTIDISHTPEVLGSFREFAVVSQSRSQVEAVVGGFRGSADRLPEHCLCATDLARIQEQLSEIEPVGSVFGMLPYGRLKGAEFGVNLRFLNRIYRRNRVMPRP
jgi:hypothetical protein